MPCSPNPGLNLEHLIGMLGHIWWDGHVSLVLLNIQRMIPTFPRKTTPESKGARPCKHCGSGKHWDNECKYAKTASHSVCSRYSSVEEDNADLAYEDLYLEALHDSESETDTSPAHVNSVAGKTDEESEDSLSDI